MEQNTPVRARIVGMYGRIAFELFVLLGCVSVYPLTVAALVLQNQMLSPLFALLTRGMFVGGEGPWGTSVWLWARVFAPYVLVQSVRLALWLTDRSFESRWFLLAGFAMFSVIGGALLWKALDLLLLMRALGDLPGELGQFFTLEGRDLFLGTASTGVACTMLGLYLAGKKPPPGD